MLLYHASQFSRREKGLSIFFSYAGSLLGCCHGVRRVLPFQCSLAGTPLWCVVSGLTVVCAWDIEPVSLFGCPPDYLN